MKVALELWKVLEEDPRWWGVDGELAPTRFNPDRCALHPANSTQTGVHMHPPYSPQTDVHMHPPGSTQTGVHMHPPSDI